MSAAPERPPTALDRPRASATDPLHASAVTALTSWRAPDHDQDSLRHALLSYLAARPDACLRECVPGHLTASMLLVDATGERALLTLHPRVGLWLQLGGHCESSDESIAGAALREGIEESGIDGIAIDPVPLHLAVHPITCSLGVPTRHLDVRFLGVAPPGAEARSSDESLDLRWWAFSELDTAPLMAPDVPIMAAHARRRLENAQTSASRLIFAGNGADVSNVPVTLPPSW